MIIFADKNLYQNSLYPDTDWTGTAKWIIPDSNTELCQKAFEYCPYFDVIEDEEGKVVDIISIEKPISLFINQKLSELSNACNTVITSGIDVDDKHYSLTINDQMNLEGLKNNITGNTTFVPYHADGELCAMYSVEDFLKVYKTASEHKMYHTTYYNQLKDMINKMIISSEIEACYYGMPLDEEHQNNMNILLGLGE